MCELLVRVVDKKRSGNPALDCRRSGRGDVIVVAPDGHPWSRTERTAPEWVIVRVPGMTVNEGLSLSAPELAKGVLRQGVRGGNRHRRLYRLDVDSLLGPHSGRRSRESVTLSLKAVRDAKQKKPPVLDPHRIGNSKPSYVLG